ncbi:MAG: RDD family protein [Thermoanaerobaculia bacterium]
MRRPGKPNEPEEPLLFDLPLSAPGSEPEEELFPVAPKRASRETRRTGPVPVPVPEPGAREAAPEKARSEFAGPVRRIAAGLADLIVHAAVGVLALLGCRWLEVRPEVREWPAFAAFLLAFSFLYTVLPLAFWGHTPGMAWAAITSRNRDGEPLSFDQTVRRWLGGLLTLALVGLPLLLAFGGRTLTDWISGSATYPFDESE